MSDKVKINIVNEQLIVSMPPDSPFLEGMHRIFLANVIGLEPISDNSESFSGYTLNNKNGNISDTIIELIEYFKDEGGEVDFDVESNHIVTAFEQGSSDFQDSEAVGLKIKTNIPEKIDVPGFKRELKKYQVGPVAHMVEVGNAANFSVPGSGKTTVTLAGYSILKNRGIVDKIVVVGPRAAFMSWEDEFLGCFGIKPTVVRITGAASMRRKLYRKASAAELILISYQMIANDVNRLSAFLSDHKVLLILDESHYIKRMEGGKWANTVLKLAPLATRRVILSGTPVPNSLEDLWSQMTFLWPNPKVLGTTSEYKDRINSLGNGAADEIRTVLKPFYWRIHKSDLKLKRPKFHRIKVTMRPYQQAIYDAIAVRILSEIVKAPEERMSLREWRRARTIRLLQVSSNPTLLEEYSDEFRVPPLDATGLPVSELIEKYPEFEVPPKIEAVVELTEKLINEGEKVLIWTSFVHNITVLQKLLEKHKPRIVRGDVPKDKNENESFNREKMIRDFKESKKYNVLIANPSACAESVSLHKVCHHAIYVDRTFNCAQYMQSLDRIHRIGLDPNEQVHYHIFQSANSIDTVIDNRLKEKQERMLKLLDDDFAIVDLEASYSELSEESEEDDDFQAIIKQLRDKYEV